MLSIIITSFKEADSIAEALRCILNPKYSGIPNEFELITVIPDDETYKSAKIEIQKWNVKNWIHIKDPLKGKPHAINLAFKRASGEIMVLTDGDVHFEKNAVGKLIQHFTNNEIGGVTGRPMSSDTKNSFMGYIGHLLADAAHHKRMVTMLPETKGKSLSIVSKKPNFFVLSGYIMAIRNSQIEVPEDCLIEDAFISYNIVNSGQKLIYEPEAKVNVKYAKTISDWYRQKLRSVGGYVQLWKYGVIKEDTNVRDFWKELEYFWFPIKYAKKFQEIIWSLILYPIRLLLWIRIFIEQKFLKKDLAETWVRIESTK